MKLSFILITFLTLFSVSFAQAEEWLWAKQAGGTGFDGGFGIATDSSGNSYVTGNFSGTATFGTTTLTSSGDTDIFITKLDNIGNYLWAKQAGGTSWSFGSGIAIDSSGNSYVMGDFSGTANFGTTMLTSSGGDDIFIAKLDANGNFLWAKKAGGTDYDHGNEIATDSYGNSYVTGHFEGSATFGTTTLTSSGGDDIFITKLDTIGNWLWAKKAGGTGWDYGESIAADSNGNSYVTGMFTGYATFGTSALTCSGSSYIFITKLDSNGDYLWAKKAGGVGNFNRGKAIAIDNSGNSYVTGVFEGSATFGTTMLTSHGSSYSDMFVVKLDTYGNFLWATQAGGTYICEATAISTDSTGNSSVTGRFNGTVAFGTTTLTSSGYSDIFITKLDSNGNHLWAKKAGGTGSEYSFSIATDSYGNSYVTGDFSLTANFGISALTCIGDPDIFVAKIASYPLLHINEASMDLDTAYLGYDSTHDLCLRNIGANTLSVDSLSFRLTDTPFELIGLSLPLEIAYGDSALVQIRFTPLAAGAVTDSLIIYNNSVNLPRAAIRLSGTGQYVPPLPPENVALLMQGNDAIISWDAVTETELHTPIVPDFYLVFFNGSSDINADTYFFLGWTNSLSYTHSRVGQFSPSMFYRVRAYKDYGRSLGDIASRGLVMGMREDEVFRALDGRR